MRMIMWARIVRHDPMLCDFCEQQVMVISVNNGGTWKEEKNFISREG